MGTREKIFKSDDDYLRFLNQLEDKGISCSFEAMYDEESGWHVRNLFVRRVVLLFGRTNLAAALSNWILKIGATGSVGVASR